MFDAQEEVRIDQHPFERELDAGVEAAPANSAALEETEQRVQVVGRDRTAIGAPRQARQDRGGAGPCVRVHRGVRLADEDRAAARRIPGTGDVVGPTDGDRADCGVAVIRLIVRQNLARLPRRQDPFRLPDVAHERHADHARSRLDRHANLQPIVRLVQIRLPGRVARLGDRERDRRGPAAGLAADREPLDQRAVDPDVELMRRAHAEDVVLPVRPQLDLDEVLAVDREVIRDGHAAPRAEWQILTLAVVLPQEQRHVEGLEARSGRRQARGEARDGARRGQVAFELRRRDRQYVGVVVEAGIGRLVARQQRSDVEIERKQVAYRVAILGPVQPVDRAGAARIRAGGRGAVDRGLQVAGHASVGRLVRPGSAAGRHRPGAQLVDDPLPDFRVSDRRRRIDGIERQAPGLQPRVVAGHAVAVEHRPRVGRGGGRRLSRHQDRAGPGERPEDAQREQHQPARGRTPRAPWTAPGAARGHGHSSRHVRTATVAPTVALYRRNPMHATASSPTLVWTRRASARRFSREATAILPRVTDGQRGPGHDHRPVTAPRATGPSSVLPAVRARVPSWPEGSSRTSASCPAIGLA